MKTAIKKSLQSALLVPVLALGLSAALPAFQPADVVYAQNIDGGIRGGVDDARGDDQPDELFGTGGGGIFNTIVNVLLFIIGAVAVIMLIYGGFKYVTSGGDSSAVTSAKNTILYAVIGIVVALLAYAILDFVLDSLNA